MLRLILFMHSLQKHPSNARGSCNVPGRPDPGGGTRYIKEVGMLVENFEIDP